MSLIPAVVIDTGLAVHLEYQFNSWSGPIEANGALWGVFTRGGPTYGTAPDRGTHVYKSTDAGVTWTVQDVAGNPGPTVINSYSYPFALGNTWYFLTNDNSGGNPAFTIYAFNLSTGTWGSSVTTFTDTGISSANNVCLVCLRGSPQQFVVFYRSGLNEFARQYDGSSWGSIQSIANAGSMLGVAVDNSNICHVFKRATSTTIKYIQFASGAFVGSYTTIDSSYSDNTVLSIVYRPVQDDIVFCYPVSALTSVAWLKGTPTSSPTWTRTTISVPGGHLANPQGATIAFSPEENYTSSYLLFASVDSAGDHGRLYQCDDTGSGFGAAALVWDAGVDTINYPAGWNVKPTRNKLAYAYAVTLNAAQDLLMCFDGAAFVAQISPDTSFDFVALYGALDVTPPTTSGNRMRAWLI